MLKQFTLGTHRVLLCGACTDARGLAEADLFERARRSTMDELAQATAAADKVLVFRERNRERSPPPAAT